MKSLIVIIHYNTPRMTDSLYEMLKPYEKEDYDVTVLDNGSDPDKISKYATYKSPTNEFYGGGLDMSMELFINSPEYDSLGVLNSDLILHGYNLVKKLRESLFSQEDLMVVSPCVIQPTHNQCFWPALHCWNSTKIRFIPAIDFQFVLMKRQFVEKVKSFNSKYGWIQDIMTGFICADNNWKIGVCDWIPIIHLENQTVKSNPHLSNYNKEAQIEMDEYFKIRGLEERVKKLREAYKNYTHYE